MIVNDVFLHAHEPHIVLVFTFTREVTKKGELPEAPHYSGVDYLVNLRGCVIDGVELSREEMRGSFDIAKLEIHASESLRENIG